MLGTVSRQTKLRKCWNWFRLAPAFFDMTFLISSSPSRIRLSCSSRWAHFRLMPYSAAVLLSPSSSRESTNALVFRFHCRQHLAIVPFSSCSRTTLYVVFADCDCLNGVARIAQYSYRRIVACDVRFCTTQENNHECATIIQKNSSQPWSLGDSTVGFVTGKFSPSYRADSMSLMYGQRKDSRGRDTD